MSTENNNLFADFEPLKNAGSLSAVDFSASEPLSGLTDGTSSRFQGLIPEPTDALFDKMWESCDSLNSSVPHASVSSLSGRTEFQPLSPDAFMSTGSVLEGRGSAPAFDDVLPERIRTVQTPVQQPENPVSEKAIPDEIAYFEELWRSGDFPKKEKSPEQILWESGISNPELISRSNESDSALRQDRVDVPQLLSVKTGSKKLKKQVKEKRSESQIKPVSEKAKPVQKANDSKSWGGWALSLISCLVALVVGLFIFGWNMIPAYLVQSQIQQATGLSLRMKNVSQDFRAGVTSVESVQAFDSAQRPFFETGHAVFSSLPYFIGDNQYIKWATVEGIRFASTPAYVNPNAAALSNNEFNKALKCVGKELDDSQIEMLVKNSVSTISAPYEQTIRAAEQEVKDITKQIQVLQERLLASGEEATDADKAQATSYQQRMQMALSNMSIEESQYNQRNAALLNNLRSKRDQSRAESNIPAITHGEVTEYLFGQDYTEFTGLLLYEIRQFCRWLPADLEKALGSVDKLDPASLSFRRIDTQEQLGVGQLRLTGQTQFMNQTVPFSAVISNYSTKPNGKPLTLDIAFGEDQSARLRLEARRGESRTELKVEFASSNVAPGTVFGLADGLHVKLEPDEKTPFIQARSIQFIVADGRIQGEYAMAQSAPSISIGVKGVHSESNVARLQGLVQSVEKITLNGTISGQFAKPEFRVSSNLESWGQTVLAVAANEYDARMDAYRTAIEQKSSEVIESEHTRIAKMAQNVKVSANGNALMLNQLCSGVVDSQIVLPQTPSDSAEENLAEAPVEVQEEVSDLPTVADSEPLALPSLGEQTTELGEQTTEENVVTEVAPEDMPFPELPSAEPETAQPSAQIAAGDVALEALPPLEDSDAAPLTAENSNIADSNANNVTGQQTEDLPALPDVEDLTSMPMVEENVEIPADLQSSALPQLPSLEELGPKAGVQSNAPTELSAPSAAMEINSRDANYQSPEMEFLDDEPMEEALPVDEVEQTGDAIPLVAPNTTPQRVTPPSLPVIIED